MGVCRAKERESFHYLNIFINQPLVIEINVISKISVLRNRNSNIPYCQQ